MPDELARMPGGVDGAIQAAAEKAERRAAGDAYRQRRTMGMSLDERLAQMSDYSKQLDESLRFDAGSAGRGKGAPAAQAWGAGDTSGAGALTTSGDAGVAAGVKDIKVTRRHRGNAYHYQ